MLVLLFKRHVWCTRYMCLYIVYVYTVLQFRFMVLIILHNSMILTFGT